MASIPEISPKIYKELSEELGQNVRTPAGATALAYDISAKTGIMVSVNTIKRFVGIFQSAWIPSGKTLKAIAKYLGHYDFKSMNDGKDYFSSRFSPRSDNMIDMSKFLLGTSVKISWTPASSIIVFHNSKNKFEVKESINCILKPGDILTMSQLAKDYRFFADMVVRNGHPIGAYIASEDTIVEEVDILDIDRQYLEAHREYYPWELGKKGERKSRIIGVQK